MIYDDILYTQYPFDHNHPKMDLNSRAKIFLPFSALKGYEEKIEESIQLYDTKVELSNETKLELNEKLIELSTQKNPSIYITYFEPQKSQTIGQYQTMNGIISKLELEKGYVIINDIQIEFSNIYNIE